MPTLSKADRDKVADLLASHSDATDALAKIGKSGFAVGLNVTNESGNEYVDLSLDKTTAKAAVTAALTSIEAKLAKFGIKVS